MTTPLTPQERQRLEDLLHRRVITGDRGAHNQLCVLRRIWARQAQQSITTAREQLQHFTKHD
mgnify:CR=1 FL=1|jgi:hypothetical protein